jgi:hypothetical protein
MWTSAISRLSFGSSTPHWRVICECQRHRRRGTALGALRLVARSHLVVSFLALLLASGFVASPLGASIPSVDLFLESARSWMSWGGGVVDEPEVELGPPTAVTTWYDGDTTRELVRELYFRSLVPYGEIILEEARVNDLSPELVAAVVKTESDFRPRLVSHKDAHGLMQIIPSTGRLMGASDLFNPHDNIRTGTKYLRYLSDRYAGDRTMTLAAYNAGLGNVERYGGVPPFTETQNYLVRVARSNREYERKIRESVAQWNLVALRLRD